MMDPALGPPQSARPATVTADLRRLPAALEPLIKQNRWVVWRWTYVPARQKWTKVPFQPDRPSQKARSNDRYSWGTYQAALDVVARHDADGIGYQLADGDIAAFDLDDCRNPETGVIAPWAWTQLDAASSYAEVTVSGTGLRIIGRALGEHVHRKFALAGCAGSLEIYRQAKRFIVLTGLQIEGRYDQLVDVDPAIDAAVTFYDAAKSASVDRAAEPGHHDDPSAFPQTREELSGLPPALSDLIRLGAPVGERSEQFHHAVGWLKDLDWSEAAILALLEQHPTGIAAKYEGRLRAEIQRCFAKTGRATSSAPVHNPSSETPSLKLRWHGDPEDLTERRWLVSETIPETGKGLLSGQWGTGKTFVAIDLAGSIMSGTNFAGRRVLRAGGVLFIAAEGANEVSIRLRGVVESKLKEEASVDPSKLERLPFAWLDECPSLLSRDAIGVLKATATAAAAKMRAEFDLPLALIVIDTLMAASDFEDENDAAQGQKVMRVLEDLSRHTGAFALAVDHFGKAVETGTRGTSAKEGAADAVLALLADKDITGNVSNTRMAVRKLRGGATGALTPFQLKQVTFPPQKAFAPTTTCIIEWSAPDVSLGKACKPDRWPTSLRVFQAALTNTIAENGQDKRPFGYDGPVVRATSVASVRSEFHKVYPADNEDPAKRLDAKRRAFDRALDNALGKRLVTTREINGVDHIWACSDEPTERTSTQDRQDTS